MRSLERSFRDACEGDWPFVARLFVESVLDDYAGDEQRAAAHVEARHERWKRGGGYALVAVEEGRPLAVVWVLPDVVAADGDYVQLIAVNRPERRRGIADGLLRAAIERSRQRGRRSLRAGVARRNRASRALFEGLGFAVEDPEAALRMMRLRLDVPGRESRSA